MGVPLTVSYNRTKKVHERLKIAAQVSGVPERVFQMALQYPGTALEDEFTALEDELVEVFIRFSKKIHGIITPVRAEDTGLIPHGWSVYVKKGVRQDFLEGNIDLTKLNYGICLTDWNHVEPEETLERANNVHAYGSLGLAAALSKAKDEGKEIFPVESRKYYFIMPRTILLDENGHRRIAAFRHNGKQWLLHFYCFSSGFGPRGRFVCPDEEQPLTA